jgi:hypothetical protein
MAAYPSLILLLAPAVSSPLRWDIEEPRWGEVQHVLSQRVCKEDGATQKLAARRTRTSRELGLSQGAPVESSTSSLLALGALWWLGAGLLGGRTRRPRVRDCGAVNPRLQVKVSTSRPPAVRGA